MGMLFNNDDLCIHSANAETSFTDRCREVLVALNGYAGGDSLLDTRHPLKLLQRYVCIQHQMVDNLVGSNNWRSSR